MDEHELEPPPECGAKNGMEIARLWQTEDLLRVVIRTNLWEDDAFGWGMVLADLARHVANSHAPDDDEARRKVLNRVIQGMNAELKDPTDEPKGHNIE